MLQSMLLFLLIMAAAKQEDQGKAKHSTVAERGTAAPVTIFPELIHICRNLFWKWSLGNESVFRLITGKISISSVGSPEISGAQQL